MLGTIWAFLTFGQKSTVLQMRTLSKTRVLALWQLPCPLRHPAAAVLPAPLSPQDRDPVLAHLAEPLPITALLRCPAAAEPSWCTAAHPRCEGRRQRSRRFSLEAYRLLLRLQMPAPLTAANAVPDRGNASRLSAFRGDLHSAWKRDLRQCTLTAPESEVQYGCCLLAGAARGQL